MKIDYFAGLDLGRMAQDFHRQRAEWKAAGRWAIFSEELDHASGVDGIRPAHADVSVHLHKDMAALGTTLDASEHDSTLVMSDGVSSMDGDVAPIGEVVRLARSHGALVMFDDAHGVGMLGEDGRGGLEHIGVDPGDVHLQMGTFTIAFGAVGGFVAGDNGVIGFHRVSARTYIFSAPLPPAVASGLAQAIDIAEREDWRREQALENAHFFRREIGALGYETLSSEVYIVPVLIGAESHAGRGHAGLAEARHQRASRAFPGGRTRARTDPLQTDMPAHARTD